MVETTNDCVNCGLPCIGRKCPYYSVTHWHCDQCGIECDPNELYIYENDELCQDCLMEKVIDNTETVGDRIGKE